jgi:hypothetical protein
MNLIESTTKNHRRAEIHFRDCGQIGTWYQVSFSVETWGCGWKHSGVKTFTKESSAKKAAERFLKTK